MKLRVLVTTILLCAAAYPQASPYSNSVFPAQLFTSASQTGPTIQLNGLSIRSTIGSSFASGTITLTGSSITTVGFGLQGSSDNGVTYFPLLLNSVTNPGTSVTTMTATASGLYQVNLAGLTHVKFFTTSDPFTATNISLTLTGSPNAMPAVSSGGGSVKSVNGQTGPVVLGAGDVGALPITGGILQGPLTLAADPSTPNQAATKNYVDTHPGGGGSGGNAIVTTITVATTVTANVTPQLFRCTGTFTITLPALPAVGELIYVKNTGAGVITVSGGGANLIDGATTFAIPAPNSTNLFIWDSTSRTWNIS